MNLRIVKDLPEYKSMTLPIVGCLGNDFLINFKVIVDPVNQVLILERKK